MKYIFLIFYFASCVPVRKYPENIIYDSTMKVDAKIMEAYYKTGHCHLGGVKQNTNKQ